MINYAKLIDTLSTAHGLAMDMSDETITTEQYEKLEDLVQDIMSEIECINTVSYDGPEDED